MKILFLHEVNYKTKPIFEMHEFPEYLSNRGHRVGFVHYPEGSKYDRVSASGSWQADTYQRLETQGVIELFTPRVFFANSVLGRLISALTAFGLLKSIFKEFKPDIVVTYAVPTYGWQATILCRLSKIPIAYRAIDVSHKIRGGQFTPLVWLAERFIIRFASIVIANSPAMKNYCDFRGATKSITSPPIISMEGWGARASNQKARRIVFLGTFFKFSGLIEFVTYFASHSGEEDRLVLAGAGPYFSKVQKIVDELGISNKLSLPGWVGFDEIGRLLIGSKVAVNPMMKRPVTEFALPNKVLQYLAAGIPTVSTRLAGLESYFGENPQCSLFFEDSPEAVARKALSLLNEVGPYEECRALEQFNDSSAIGRFEQALENALCAKK